MAGQRPSTAEVAEALRKGWSPESCVHDNWDAENPAKGQCEPSSFVAWEHLGGSLVLGQVFINDEFSEHHYWNRINGQDIDFTADQFDQRHDIREVAVLASEELQARQHEMRPDFKARIDVLRKAVAQHLT